MADSTDLHTMRAGAFDSSWVPLDASALDTASLPVTRVARAWERKPHAASGAQRPGLLKVWRRVRMPSGHSQTGPREVRKTARHSLDNTEHRGLLSPKKAIKKLCLDTDYGQDWRTTEWETARGTRARKESSRPPIVLRSGTKLDPDFDPFADVRNTDDCEPRKKAVVVNIAAEDEAAIDDLVIAEDDEGWEDVDSDLDLDVDIEDAPASISDADEQNATIVLVSAPAMEGAMIASTPAEQDPSHAPSLGQMDHGKESVEPDVEQNRVAETLDEDEVPVEELANTIALEPEVDSGSATFESPPIVRPSSAPPRDTEIKEERIRPRISDDTAILHAFLNRAAASKKPPTARRESLTNKRDSGLVRNALASPLKPEVLAELDANSPSPHKAARAVSPLRASSPKKATESEEHESEDKPARRSGRSRARPVLLVNQMAEENSTKIPNKITVRQASEPVTIKRTDVQEVAVQTRSNTRKNKGGSVMPLVRLSKLKEVPPSPLKKDISETTSNDATHKSVRWDSTLAYYSDQQDPARTVAVTVVDAAPSLSPTKARTRRTRASKTEEPAQASEVPVAEEVEIPAAAAPKPATMTKRRSRIATPAKGLLTKTSLLPDDLVATAEVPATNSTSAATSSSSAAPSTSASQTAVAATRKRGLPLPSCTKRSTTSSNPSTAPPAPSSVSTSSPRKTSATTAVAPLPSLSLPNSTTAGTTSSNNSGSSISSAPCFAPRITDVPRLTTLGFEEALAAPTSMVKGVVPSLRSRAEPDEQAQRCGGGVVPGLASPAKRRRRAVVGMSGAGAGDGSASGNGSGSGALEERCVPGLCSPAKKRRRAVG